NHAYKAESGLLLSKDGKTLVAVPGGLVSVAIPASVTSIEPFAFVSCAGLTSVSIPDSVTSIGEQAFIGCSGLTSIAIGNGVTSIGDFAFANCEGLTSVTIPNSVTSIGEQAFYGCSGLTSIAIGNGVTSIGLSAFANCEGLTSVTIPNSVTSIGRSAFDWCRGLTSVTIGNSVTNIGESAFFGCESLVSVTIPNSVTNIGESAFFGCESLVSVTIPDSVTSIGLSAFADCEGLTSVTIPNSVTSIGERAFYGCSGLTSVTIGNSVTNIGDYAFYECRGLTSITFGGNAPEIGQYSFHYLGDCTVYICYDSTGWGVDIPGIWNGLWIEYMTVAVTFDANGGKSGESQRYVEEGNALGALPMPARTGYSFAGWWTAKSGGSRITAKTKVTKDVTYYARWTANKYKIKFNANGGAGTMKNLSAAYGKSVKLTANAFKRSKHTFQGWAKKMNGEVAYADRAKVKNLTATDGKTVTLYAVWKHNSYKVKFNANGGTGAAQSQTVNCGAKTKLAANSYVREGFVFAGWAKKKGGPVVYKNKASVKDLAKNGKTVTLYAVWKPAKWAVGTFKGEGEVGGKAATATLTVSSSGKISGKFVRTKDKKTYSFTADGFDEFSYGALRATTALKYGSKTCSLEIAVGQAVPDDGVVVTFAEMEATAGGKTCATAFLQIRK
ncbi:MAG: leucine-rich repeat protein, partial [Kiritimatiellae bacterium]|nr:leucine-rich repeat protein [Kiritimatiellia bacterium]